MMALCRENMTMKALAEDTEPDFATIAMSIRTKGDMIKSIFKNVLMICETPLANFSRKRPACRKTETGGIGVILTTWLVADGYSFTLESMRELEINVTQSLNKHVSIEKRY